MHLGIDHADLSRGLATVARAVPARTPMPILTGILARAEGDSLVLSATDLEIGIECSVPARVESPGALVLPSRYLTEIVRRIPAGEIAWNAADDRSVAELAWQRSRFTIQGFSADQFPPFPAFPDSAPAVSGPAFAQALRHTVFAASQDAARPVLTGVELFIAGSEFRALSTDGTRVAYHRNPSGRDDWDGAQRLLVPARALQEVLRLLDAGTDLRAAVRDNQLLLELNGTRVVIRLLDGRYPAVLELLPKEYPTVVRAERAALHDACERVSLVADTPERLYAITLTAGADRLSLAAHTPDVGEASEEVAASVDGPEIDVGINARLLLEGLRHIEGGEVLVEFSGKLTAMRLRQPEEPGFVYMQMPIRIG